ncbi:MAG: hypothetical protein ACRD9Q_08520, partial [Nitrososphaeraceae archaeon]
KEIRVFQIELWGLDVIRERVLKKLDLLKTGTIPPRTVTWKCRFCPWLDLCHPEEEPGFAEKIKN